MSGEKGYLGGLITGALLGAAAALLLARRSSEDLRDQMDRAAEQARDFKHKAGELGREAVHTVLELKHTGEQILASAQTGSGNHNGARHNESPESTSSSQDN